MKSPWPRDGLEKTGCKAKANRIFAHAGTTHDLVTTRQVAAKQHAIQIGSAVQFTFAGQRHIGIVNRIHHRVTVLVESPRGTRYSNGKTYLKFYIPLRMLEAVKSEGEYANADWRLPNGKLAAANRCRPCERAPWWK